jgi:hypothetical protein
MKYSGNTFVAEFFKNMQNRILLGAWGTLIHEKNLKLKISCQTHFNIAGRNREAEMEGVGAHSATI